MSAGRALPPEVFAEAFPFHIWVDGQLRLLQAGAVIQRLVPKLVEGAPLPDILRIKRPRCRLEAESLRAHAKQHFVLELVEQGMRLRGQLVAMDDGSLLFLLLPWVNDEREMEAWGLSLSDFPIHTPVADHLFLLGNMRTNLEDTSTLVEQLERQRCELLESRMRTDLHLRHTPLAIIDWDSEGTIAGWNPAAARIFERDEQEALGRGPESLAIVGLVDRQGELGSFDGAELLTRTNERLVLSHDLGEGRSVLAAWHNTPLVDAGGRQVGVASVVRDVTEATRNERAMRERQKLESLGLLAGGVAHDFNNLLAALLGQADLALLEAPPGSRLVERIEEIAATAERAAGLTRQLLDYAGQSDYRMKPLHLEDLVDEMRGLLRISVPKRVQLEVDGPGDLPAIAGDASQLRQVVMNLVINGAEAIGEGGGRVRIRTRRVELGEALAGPELRGGPLAPGTYLRLSVEDDGEGMDAGTLGRIFDPFFTTKFTGRGLGLAAILGIVRGHEGALRVESTPGEGTHFELFFPALDSAVPRTIETVPTTRYIGKGRLLVVDDEVGVRRMLAEALAGAGFEVVAAEAGAQALELFESDDDGFDLVLTDLAMPGLDGQALFDELTARDPQLPVILSSGYSEREVAAAYPDGEPVVFLKKPFRVGLLIETVRQVLSRRAR